MKTELNDKELIEICREWISKMCKTGGNAFTMSVPVRLNYDTDVVLSELINRFEASQFKSNWIDVKERLPENPKEVLGYCKGTIVCFYTKGREVEYESDDDDIEYDEYEDAKRALFLKAGWYQRCEQKSGDYDSLFIHREITHWMPKPTTPTN